MSEFVKCLDPKCRNKGRHAHPIARGVKLHKVEITICEPCLNGVGEMCHTPGCALIRHKVDLPIQRAVEIVAHQIAGATHLMLAQSRTTVAELKISLDAMPMKDGGSELLDDLLAARNPHLMKMSFLSDVAFALGGEWSFEVRKMVDVPLPQATE